MDNTNFSPLKPDSNIIETSSFVMKGDKDSVARSYRNWQDVLKNRLGVHSAMKEDEVD